MFRALVGLMLVQFAGVELPEAPCAGWKADPQRVVEPSDIFRYMNGAGELYLSYGFKKLLVREYQKPGQPKVTCELYRLPSSADAYGLFSQDRTGEPMRIGQGAIYGSGLLIAWQGQYFIRAMADRETDESKRFLTELAKQVVKLCGPPGEPPKAISWLPGAGLDKQSIHYFHTHSCLNYYHFLSTDNLLALSLKANVVLGTYVDTGGKSLALVAGYPKATDARAAWAKFQRVYLAGLKTEGEYSLAQLENGKWIAGTTSGSKLMLVLESPTRDTCTHLIKALKRTNTSIGRNDSR